MKEKLLVLVVYICLESSTSTNTYDDFIFNAMKTRKIITAKMAAKATNTMAPFCFSQLTHVPDEPPLGAAKLGAHCEQRKLRLLFITVCT